MSSPLSIRRELIVSVAVPLVLFFALTVFVLDGIFVRNSMRMRLRPEVRADDVGFRVLRQNTDPAVGPVPAARP